VANLLERARSLQLNLPLGVLDDAFGLAARLVPELAAETSASARLAPTIDSASTRACLIIASDS
jgi:hypothetical protein